MYLQFITTSVSSSATLLFLPAPQPRESFGRPQPCVHHAWRFHPIRQRRPHGPENSHPYRKGQRRLHTAGCRHSTHHYLNRAVHESVNGGQRRLQTAGLQVGATGSSTQPRTSVHSHCCNSPILLTLFELPLTLSIVAPPTRRYHPGEPIAESAVWPRRLLVRSSLAPPKVLREL